jgi:integrase/recombinase XerD
MNRLVLQFTAYLHINQYSQNSIQDHRLDLLRFISWLETREFREVEQLRDLAREDLLAYQAHLAQRLRPRSVNRHLSTLRILFRFLAEQQLISGNPMESISFPKLMPSLPTMLLPGDVTALLSAPQETHYLGLRDRTLMEVLYSAGLKLHELIQLNLADLELEVGVLRVRGRRERLVPLTSRSVGLLRRYLEEARRHRLLNPEDPCLFPGRNGTRISRVGVWKLIKKYARAAGIEKNFSPRNLRHAFAIHMILGGMDLDGIKRLFGYKQLEATALYAHVNAPDFRAAYQAYHPSAARPKAEGVDVPN